MNNVERKMLELLHELKESYDALAVKSEFEAEGSRLDELLRLNELIFRADMKSVIKIGGCEAVSDLKHAKTLGASGIMAPMIESPFAMAKFKRMAHKVYYEHFDENVSVARGDIDWIINIETKTAWENMEDIFTEGDNFLTSVVIGRSDLSASLGLTRAEINDKQIFFITNSVAQKAKERGFNVGVGGNINLETIPFLKGLNAKIDRFETRKIIFRFDDQPENFLKKAIELAVEFEMLYLENKFNLYSSIANEDLERWKSLKHRI